MENFIGNIVDVRNRNVFYGVVMIDGSFIVSIERLGVEDKSKFYILPGFIDAHVHIESSMVTPGYFAQHVVKYGTVGVIADPHEISNVCGVDGFDYMYTEARNAPLNIFYAIPSCVPATPFETSGAVFTADVIRSLFEKYDGVALAEMMNFPGVIHQFPEVLAKLQVAKQFHKKIDGHAPGLSGSDLLSYVAAGISTDHEAFSYQEAKEKILAGMKIQIREGSAARNFSALHPLIDEFPNSVMFCTDDAHPDTLITGHIDRIVRMAVHEKHDIFNVLKASSLNAIDHYNLPIGDLTPNASADFIVVDNLSDFNLQQTVVKGSISFQHEVAVQSFSNVNLVNNFNVNPISADAICLPYIEKQVRIIKALDGELITEQIIDYLPCKNGFLLPDLQKDYLKMVVVNRYKTNALPSIGFIKGFNLANGAMASSVAHDSHNIICVGTSDEHIVKAVNTIIASKGGIVFVDDESVAELPLPVGGLMANLQVDKMALLYNSIDQKVKNAGCAFKAPFMTLAFMSLLVIPSLKLGDKGLFDVNKFEFVDLFVE